MRKFLNYFVVTLTIITFALFLACNKNDDEVYTPVQAPVSVKVVNVDLTTVPYAKLSDYNFFSGDLKNQIPAENVIPYEPASSLFTDYAKKKRFVWLPKNQKATFNGVENVLELPIGSVIIKTFYYDNVLPSNTTKVIETRLLIRKDSGWIFAEYVWNDAQTDAVLNLDGSTKNISWNNENNVTKSVNYRIPNKAECAACHKKIDPNGVSETYIPIGIKPQNLNTDYNYTSGSKNQLTKWIELGLLENNFTFPDASNSVVNYKDTSKSLELRARSYLDINCAHCHQLERKCAYRSMRFAFKSTGAANGKTNLGICSNTEELQGTALLPFTKIISPANLGQSMLHFRINTTDEAYRMPQLGRTIIHEEGVALMEQWINSLQPCR